MSLLVRDLRRSRKTYSFSRKQPTISTVTPGVGPDVVFPTETIDVSRYKKEYDSYQKNHPFIAESVTYLETGTFLMSAEDTKTHSFTNPFFGVPVVTIEPVDFYSNSQNNVATYILDLSSSSMTIGTSASFTGQISYKAVWFNWSNRRSGYIGTTYYVIEKHVIAFSGEESKEIVFNEPFNSIPSVWVTPLDTGYNEACIDLDVTVSTTGSTITTNRSYTGSVLFQAMLY